MASTDQIWENLKDTGLGGKGGGQCALKNGFGFGGIPNFLEITYVGEAYLIFEKN